MLHSVLFPLFRLYSTLPDLSHWQTVVNNSAQHDVRTSDLIDIVQLMTNVHLLSFFFYYFHIVRCAEYVSLKKYHFTTFYYTYIVVVYKCLLDIYILHFYFLSLFLIRFKLSATINCHHNAFWRWCGTHLP